jgi:hypothetical protein
MGCESKCGQSFLVRTDAWRNILALDPSQARVCRERKDAVTILGKDHDVSAGLGRELATPALPPDRLVPRVSLRTWPTLGRRQGEPQEGQQHVEAHRPRGFLWRMVHTPRRLTRLETAMLDQTAVIIGIEGRQGVLHRGIGQQDGRAPWAIIPPMPTAHDHGVEGLGLQVPAGVMTPMLRRPILGIGRQPGDPHDLRLQSRGPGGCALALADGMSAAADGDLFTSGRLGLRVDGHRPLLRGRHHQDEPLRLEPPPLHPIQQPPSNDHRMPTGMTGQGGARWRDQRAPGARFMRLDRDHRRGPGARRADLKQPPPLPAIDRDLELVTLGALGRELPLPGDLATAFRRGRRLQIGRIDEACDRGGN